MKPGREKTGLEVGTARTKGLRHGRESKKVSMGQPSERRKTTDKERDQTGTGTAGRARMSPLEDDLDLTDSLGPKVVVVGTKVQEPKGDTQNFEGAEGKWGWLPKRS